MASLGSSRRRWRRSSVVLDELPRRLRGGKLGVAATVGLGAYGLAVAFVLLGLWPAFPPGGQSHGYAETRKDPARETRFEECSTDIMRIEFERSGGFAGLRLAATIEADSLSVEEAEELCRLVEEAGFFDLSARIAGPEAQPDQFMYKITVETEARQHTVQLENTAPAPELQPLLDWLSRAARRRRRG